MLCLLLLTAALAKIGYAQYTLYDDYEASNFFSKFDFYTDTDPTAGFVVYVDEATAEADGLISTTDTQIYIGVDDTNVASSSGRNSVRITSVDSYNEALVILDLAHMPGSVCGTWPAFWMFGPDWPDDGEIDIIEGVNTNTENQMTLHTSDGCTIDDDDDDFTGVLETDNCYIDAPDQSSNAGCAIIDTSTASYGDGFNANGGGVFATEWTSSAISIWFFTPSEVPSDITDGEPDPSGWGEPAALFEGDCDIDEHFLDMNIVFDITFCGDWAGSVWDDYSTCEALDSSCDDYVQNNPTAFESTYWLINSLKVYTSDTEQTYVYSSNSTGTTEKPEIPYQGGEPLAMGGGSASGNKKSKRLTRKGKNSKRFPGFRQRT